MVEAVLEPRVRTLESAELHTTEIFPANEQKLDNVCVLKSDRNSNPNLSID